MQSEFWDQVEPARRHVVHTMDKDCLERQKKRFKMVCEGLPWNTISSAIDWGCGGGLHAKEMMSRGVDVTFYDISEESLKAAMKYCEAPVDMCYSQYAPLIGRHFDLIVAMSVIHHFDSFGMWETACQVWHSMEPRHVVLQTHRSKANQQACNYARDYMRGLSLTDEEVRSKFPGFHATVLHEGEWSFFRFAKT